jgi:heme exporter protein A
MQARLSATDLACRRGERLLFRGLSFALDAGEALQVTGPNGTGKSSLIRILAGLLRPSAGSVERTVEAALLDERLALDGDLPLGRALAFWERIDGVGYANPPRHGEGDHAEHGGAAAAGYAAPSEGAPPPPLGSSPSPGGGGRGLTDLADVPVRFLSTGQRKRAAILMSNARAAGLWLLDEPLNGLDAQACADFQRQVANYLGGGGIAVIASHQPFDVPGMRRLALADFAP